MKRTIFTIGLMLALVATVCAQNYKLQEGLALKYLVQEPKVRSAKPPVMILMHGYGSNEADLFELAQFLPNNFLVVSVRAPYPVSDNGFEWFEKDRKQQKYTPIKKMIEESRGLVLKFIPQVVSKYHADAANVYVMGFSQGAIMSYETGLIAPSVIKGIGVLSGVLPDGFEKEIKPSAALNRLRIFIAHGTADKILSFEDGKAGYDRLVKIGLKPEFHSYTGMPHSINGDVMTDVTKWLKK